MATSTQKSVAQAQVQPCRYKTGKTLGAGSYSVVKECVHIETGRYYAAKIINKRMMAGREHMVSVSIIVLEQHLRDSQVRNEIAVLKRVSVGHRNILTLVDYFETMNNCMHDRDISDIHELIKYSISRYRSGAWRRIVRPNMSKGKLLRVRRSGSNSSNVVSGCLLTRPRNCSSRSET